MAKLCEKRHPLRQAGYRRLPKVRIFQQGAGRRGAAAVRAGDASARFRTVRCAAGCVRHISTKWPSSGPASFALGIAGLTPGASPGVATRHAGCVRHISTKWPSSRPASFALGIAGLTPGASPGVATRHAGCVRHIGTKWPNSRRGLRPRRPRECGRGTLRACATSGSQNVQSPGASFARVCRPECRHGTPGACAKSVTALM